MPASAVYIHRTVGGLSSGLKSPRPDLSQNGLKYRTLCARCNNAVGKHFDPALNEFAASVRRLAECKLFLPDVVRIRVRPAAIIRAVLSHVLAARLSDQDAGFDTETKKLFFDRDMTVPTGVNVFYFIHRHPGSVVLRDIVMPAVRGVFNECGFFCIFKFYPVGFVISDLRQYDRLLSLSAFSDCDSVGYCDVPVRVSEQRRADWPENSEQGNAIFFGSEGFESVKALARSRKE